MDTSKIIKGVVGGGRYTVTAPIVKEDYGLYLKIEGLELPATYEVDFSNSEHNGTSVTMIGNADGVLIPSQFISSGKDVFAFLYHVGDNYGRTVFKFRIPNKLRPDRTNEEPTPEEQSVIDQAIAALNNAVEQTAQDVASAHGYAQASASNAESASASAQSADASREAADESEYNAQVYAENAQASATASAQSASQSAQIKADVEDLVDDAQASASASAQSATASANSATSAQGYAQSASASASSAQGYASSAQTSAQTASTKASEASTSASTASAKATEASQSASNAQGYAQTAEQAKTASQTAQGLAESARDDAEQAKDDSEQIKSDVQDLADGIDTRLVDVEDGILKAFPTDTASGAVASFTDGADGLPLKSLVVDINPVQDTSGGDPSPTNICPISGWTQVNVNHSDADMTNPTTITIDLGQTVYGGKLDVLSGVLTVDRAKEQMTYAYLSGLSSAYIEYVSSLAYFGGSPAVSVRNWNYSKAAPRKAGGIKAICNAFPISMHNSDIYASQFRTYFAVGSNITSTDDFLTAVQNLESNDDGLWICYELAEPQTYQLTPHEVNSLLGTNNIFADTGDTACEYRADTTLYISRLTEPDADMIADANITSGKYFMVGNSLYKATANIANGASIIVGTNCIRKSLSEALNEINA